jgi:uncharacterized protein YndB with AHSA1/START domain
MDQLSPAPLGLGLSSGTWLSGGGLPAGGTEGLWSAPSAAENVGRLDLINRENFTLNATTLKVTTPTDTTIVITRTFNAPRQRVWEAMTQPAKMQRWMLSPPGWAMTVCQCEAQVAGVLRLVWKNQADDSSMAIYGVFTDVVQHERMVHSEMMVLGSGEPIGSQVETHEFAESGGITTMRITQVFASKEARDGALSSGVENCMEPGFRQLDALLALLS